MFTAFLVAQSVKNLPAVQEIWIRSLGLEDPLEKEMAIYPSILAWKISWTEESLVGCSPWGHEESGMIGRLTLTYSPYHVSLDNKSFVPPFSLCVISRYNCNSWEGPHTILRGRYLPTKRPYYSPCLKYP